MPVLTKNKNFKAKKNKQRGINPAKFKQVINLQKKNNWRLSLASVAEKTGLSKSCVSIYFNHYFNHNN